MAEEWTVVRVSQKTKDELRELAIRLANDEGANPTLAAEMRSDVVTLDVVIRVLLARDKRHRERVRTYQQRRAAKRQKKAMYTCTAATPLSSPETTDGMGDSCSTL